MNEMSRPPDTSGAKAALTRVANRFQAQDPKVRGALVVAALVLAFAAYWFLGRGGAPASKGASRAVPRP
jgi:hypothetical protein